MDTLFGSQRPIYSDEVTSVYPTQKATNKAEAFANAQEVNLKLAEEGFVLLKNENNVLPLAKGGKVSLFGMHSVSLIASTSGSAGGSTGANGIAESTLQMAMEIAGYRVNAKLVDLYTKHKTLGTTSNELPMSYYSAATISSYNGYGDAAIIVFSRTGSEGGDKLVSNVTDHSNPRDHELMLDDNEKALVKHVKEHYPNKPIIVLINSSNILQIPELAEPKATSEYGVDAIFWVGNTGNNAIEAIGKLISGEVNPSGHTVEVWERDFTKGPSFTNFGNQTQNVDENGDTMDAFFYHNGEATKYATIEYREGIYVGYKYYETRYFDAVMGQGNANSAAGATQGSAWNYSDEMLYTFGHGLSYLDYTQTIKSVTVDRSVNGNITAVVEVKNTSNQDGKFLTQLYVQQPYTDYDRTNLVEKSAVMFLNSAKVDVAAGKSKEVTITIPTKYLASYAANNAKTYILDAGDYYFTAAAGAHEAVNNILAAQGKTTADGMDAAGSKAVVSWKLDQLDNTTFAIANNTTVTNVADDADLNYWLPGTGTYLTRQDWNTFPINYNKLNLKIADSPKKDQWIAEMRGETYTISDTGAAAEAVPGPKFTASEIGAEQLNNINDPYWDKLVHAITIDEAVGAVIHGGSRSDTLTNIDNPVVIQNEGPTGISAGYTDEATGKTYKFNVNSQTLLGCSFNPELAYQWGLVEGNSCLWVERYDLWGSGLTLNRTPYNGRNYEYISEDPMLTNVIGREVIQGCSDKGIINGPKHMGFNDQEHNRAGISAYMTEQKFRETDLRGFEGALSDAFGMGVMIAFNRIGATNASHHVGMIQKIVRGEWGFKGLISTDMMNNYLYFNAESMVMAGITQVADFAADNSHINLGEGGVDAVWPHISLETVSKDSNLVEQARENLKYQLYIFANSAILNISTQRVNTWWDTALTVTTYASSILAVLFFLAWVVLTLLPEKKPVVVRVENKR